jgi:hypothetical protein
MHGSHGWLGTGEGVECVECGIHVDTEPFEEDFYPPLCDGVKSKGCSQNYDDLHERHLGHHIVADCRESDEHNNRLVPCGRCYHCGERWD